ncbi:homeobox protein siamois-like [Eleutherodactylus coqui]|uniref:homeobox protein siamois-like n=1 Tax=Eleutherodactylus coqui TaxID=57060 RepID=UPI003463220F
MDPDLEQVIYTVLSLEEDYPALSPTLEDQCPPMSTIHLFPRKCHGKENEVYKKAWIQPDEAEAPAPNNRCRKSYKKEQIAFLTREFDGNPYADFTRRCWIGQLTGISEPQIQVWFQNRRARHLPKGRKPEGKSQLQKISAKVTGRVATSQSSTEELTSRTPRGTVRPGVSVSPLCHS